MKKLISFILSLVMLCTCAFASDINVIVNDTKLNFDVPPVVENGRTLVPLRAIFEALGADVNWDGATQSAYASTDGVDVSLTLGSDVMTVNGVSKKLDVPAKAVEGRTLVPVRAISEAFGCDVMWEGTQSTVHISEDKTLSELGVGDFANNPYTVVNGNVPYFNIDNYSSLSFEMYLPLDNLSRCTYAMSMLGDETLPTEDRGSISSVTPSGWKSLTFDVVPGKYLYNRCHLIGYQLSAENANECNLITGTRYFNVEGMLPFENMIADYIKETKNHVLYRVTPVFSGGDLVAKGVLMEAMSFEDRGKGICFNVFCHNVQPGITINYSDGSASSSGIVPATSNVQASDTASAGNNTPFVGSITYVLNLNSKKFHIPACSSINRMKPSNREDTSLSRDDIINRGYDPCGICKP